MWRRPKPKGAVVSIRQYIVLNIFTSCIVHNLSCIVSVDTLMVKCFIKARKFDYTSLWPEYCVFLI